MFRLSAWACIIFVLLLHGCSFNEGHHFEYLGESREYELYTPPSLDKRSGKNKPLLLVLHGNPSAGWQMRLYSGMDQVARKGDFIVAYPTARTGKWPLEDQEAIDAETGYIEAVLDDIIQRYPVDISRIYMSGISGGGIFSFVLADRLPNRIAAIGVVAGNMPRSIKSPHSMSPIPTVLFHGTEDFLYNGRSNLYSVDSTIAFLRDINDCSETHSTVQIEDRKQDKTSVELLRFDCTESVLFYQIKGGGHHWPGGTFNADRFTKLDLGNFCRDIDASQLIWDFVSNHIK